MQVERRSVALAALAVASVSSVILGGVAYYLHKKSEEDEKEEKKRKKQLYTSRQILIEVKVPPAAVPLVIGREGQTIKQIQKDTGAYVNFKEEVPGSEDRICVIRGSIETAPLAEAAVWKIIREKPRVDTVEVLVPQRACSMIIGKGGNNIRQLCKLSGAKVTVDRIGWQKSNDSRKINIKGTAEQIAQARALIEEKVKEANDIRDKMELSTANRKPRLKGKNLCIEAPEEKEEEEVALKKQVELVATASDGFMEVMVSAVDTAGHFWVQMYGPKGPDLDRLVDQMCDYYQDELNRQDNKLETFAVGDLLAAVFPHDKRWYRARVDKVIRNEDDYEDDVKLDVYYVDFGDCEIISSKDTCQLHPEFLKLQYQAVECFLANVNPIENDKWSEDANEEFNDLVHCAQWKVLMARVEGYQNIGGQPIPCLQLVDINDAGKIDVAEELVKRGFATWDTSKPAASPT